MHTNPASSATDSASSPWELLDRYFAGDLTPEERAVVEHWAQNTTEGNAELARLRRLWTASSAMEDTPLIVPDVDQALAKVHTRIQHHRPVPNFRIARMAWASIASILAITLGLHLGMHRDIPANDLLHTTTRTSTTTTRTVSYHATPGQRGIADLPDGTQVTLNAASTLTIPARFGTTTRDVHIDGEAVFTVVPAAHLPFIVRGGGARVTVLGTTFGVRAYHDDAQLRVAVLQGRVAVNDIVLQPGDIALAPIRTDNSLAPVTLHHNQAVNNTTAWTRGQLSFSSTPLSVVIADLERTYNIRLDTDDSRLRERTITGSFTARTVDELIPALEFVLNVRVTKHGRSLVLHQLAGLPPHSL